MKTAIAIFIMFFLSCSLLQAQGKITMNVDDLNSNIEKYIKKNFEGYKAVEAFKYDISYEMKIQKGALVEWLIFDKEGKFLNKKADANTEILAMQTRTSMAVKDVSSDIEKYVKKYYVDYTIGEAFMYDEIYIVKIIKGTETQTLRFDKEGEFEANVTQPKPAESTLRPAEPVPEPKPVETPVKTDTIPDTK